MGGLADITQPRPLLAVGGVAFLVVMAMYAIFSAPLKQLFSAAGWAQQRLAVAP
jgi:hypothetical protein